MASRRRPSLIITLPQEQTAIIPSWKRHGIIWFPKDERSFFPGYKEDFTLHSDIGPLDVRVSSGKNHPPIGDPDAGVYLTGMTPYWRAHSNVVPGREVKFTKRRPLIYEIELLPMNAQTPASWDEYLATI